jgi:hypothetical protein
MFKRDSAKKQLQPQMEKCWIGCDGLGKALRSEEQSHVFLFLHYQQDLARSAGSLGPAVLKRNR